MRWLRAGSTRVSAWTSRAAKVDERTANDGGRSGPVIPLMNVLVSTVLTHADRLWCGICRL
jgi:hypothetical protein